MRELIITNAGRGQREWLQIMLKTLINLISFGQMVGLDFFLGLVESFLFWVSISMRQNESVFIYNKLLPFDYSQSKWVGHEARFYCIHFCNTFLFAIHVLVHFYHWWRRLYFKAFFVNLFFFFSSKWKSYYQHQNNFHIDISRQWLICVVFETNVQSLAKLINTAISEQKTILLASQMLIY